MLCYVLIFLEVSGALQLTTRGVSREVLMFFIVQELFLYRKYKWMSHLYRLKTSRSKSIVAKKGVLIIFLLRASCVAMPWHKSSTQFLAIFFLGLRFWRIDDYRLNNIFHFVDLNACFRTSTGQSCGATCGEQPRTSKASFSKVSCGQVVWNELFTEN